VSDTPRHAIADAAREYVARGWSVIPMLPQGKRPLVAWRDFQQHAARSDQIEAWFRRWPDANVGIVTGRIPGLVVIDVDIAHGGPASVAALEERHGPLPPTVEALTGSGGRHLYFAHPGTTVANRVALRPGIDLRGDGGCVVAPPSVHPNGRRYAWRAGRGPGDLGLAAPPPQFFGAAATAPSAGHSRQHWRQLARERIDEGRRNDTIASFAGHLLRRDVDHEVVLELLLAWNRSHCMPPLPDDEVQRVVHSIARAHERDGSARP
jgi:Bifunctional DNA primase/polymerase, N-terminal/Primase C terminal 1 (PriCT-1)